jgi:hypothetical protein
MCQFIEYAKLRPDQVTQLAVALQFEAPCDQLRTLSPGDVCGSFVQIQLYFEFVL